MSASPGVLCNVCGAAVTPEQAAKLFSWYLCPQHADLAVHGARKMNQLVTDLGLTQERQAQIAQAGQGLFQAWQSVAPLVKSLAEKKGK